LAMEQRLIVLRLFVFYFSCNSTIDIF
jgi:hypothetical protein